MSRISSYALAIVIVLAVSACRGKDGPDEVARAFVDAYYVEYDFAKAMTYTDGPARIRLEEEKKLVDDARSKVAVADSRSRTYYATPEKREVSPELVNYTFNLEIKQGSNEITRTAAVMLAKKDGAFRVIGFRELGGERVADPLAGEDALGGSTSARPSNGVRTSTGAPAVQAGTSTRAR